MHTYLHKYIYTLVHIADVNVNKILVANKCDMQKQVTSEEGQALADEYNIKFFESSAKQDINVEKAFITIATEVHTYNYRHTRA